MKRSWKDKLDDAVENDRKLYDWGDYQCKRLNGIKGSVLLQWQKDKLLEIGFGKSNDEISFHDNENN